MRNPPDNKKTTAKPDMAADYLDASVAILPTVAKQRMRLLENLEIFTVYDLISYFPRCYSDRTHHMPIGDLKDREECGFTAIVRRKPSLRRKGRMSVLQTVLSDASGTIRATWFNQPYNESKLQKGETYFFFGKIRRDGKNFDVTNPAFYPVDDSRIPSILPIYPLTRGLTQGVLRYVIESALPGALSEVTDVLPPEIRERENLCDAVYAYEKIHRPDSMEALHLARERLIFEELFLVMGGLRFLKSRRKNGETAPCVILDSAAKQDLERSICNLPFELTQDQTKVIAAIIKDMRRETPMNRLIQGDVGSGKTVVAAMAILAAALCGKQSVLMAPTSILARQHAQTLDRILSPMGIRTGLLLGSTPAKQKKHLRAALEDGTVSVLVGTHAVLSDQIVFRDLALTVTDEQHRFGVRQRGTFLGREKIMPHTLVMSATPIPRTLALILYGDLDISVIRSIPAGRVPVETYIASTKDDARIYDIIRRQVAQGRQVYYVCPLIEDNLPDSADEEITPEDQDMACDGTAPLLSATTIFTHLCEEIFPDITVGLLHGDQKVSEKDAVMERFVAGDVKILVCTTVVEVGVDNQNASLMIIENAERFGLSQLHQLRGRVGRGQYRSVCILKSDKTGGVAGERLRTLCKSSDGFEIAKKDLELRGPGDFFGTRQHGIPALRIANLYRDTEVMQRVSYVIDQLFSADPLLQETRNKHLSAAFLRRFGTGITHPLL